MSGPAQVGRQERATFSVPLCILIALAVAAGVILTQNFAVARFFPHLTRMTTDFSPAYLDRELHYLAESGPKTIFFGDSVLWGYNLPSEQAAVSLLQARGCECVNLAFKGGNPANDYVLVRLFERYRVRPRLVVLEINQKVLAPTDDSYKNLSPTLATLGASLLSERDRAMLTIPGNAAGPVHRLDRALSSLWKVYAMRSDLRETFFGDSDDKPPLRRAVADDFVGAYDLSALTEKNVGVHFLNETVQALHADSIPVLAVMTPTNHGLLRDFTDTPEYRANGAFLKTMLARNGAIVADFDEKISANEFFDNDHLTVAGQRHFASMLEGWMKRS